MAVGEYCKGRLVFGVVVVLGVVLFPCMLVQDVDVKTEPVFWQKYKQPSRKTILAMIGTSWSEQWPMPLLLFKPIFHLCLQAVTEMKKRTLLRLVVLLCLGTLKCNRVAASILQNCFLRT